MHHWSELIGRAPQQACFGQYQQAIDEHLAAAVQALGKRPQPPFALDQRMPWARIQLV
ncbi:hypothetical protein D3C76_1147300 [compost metagenome]